MNTLTRMLALVALLALMVGVMLLLAYLGMGVRY